MRSFVFVALFLVINFVDFVRPEAMAMSIASMEKLVQLEKVLIDNVELYLDELEQKAALIRRNLDQMKAENEKASSDVDVYLMNPLQAFSLMRRIHSDWVDWEVYMQEPVGKEIVENLTTERRAIPTEEDYREAMDAMIRLQETYALNPIEMSAGKINGVQYGAKLSAADCFSIAYYLQNKAEYDDAALWYHSAMTLYKEDDPMNAVQPFDLTKILYFYAQTLAKQDHLDRSVLLLNRLIGINPKDANAIKQRRIWEMELKARENFPKRAPQVKAISVAKQQYYSGCRGEYPSSKPNLHCVYNTTTTPFLKLAPLKMEQLSLDPYMVIYHDVLSDVEIEHLKFIATPKLIRATVYNNEKKGAVSVSTRTSKFAWFPDQHDKFTIRINDRLADMTGFELYMSEQIQVMNYGLGGHYDTHYDFFNSSTLPVVQQEGDRIATALFYMSDVEQGGATVFPNLGLAVFPKKGSLILWYNLNSRGEGEEKTLHAACPVLVGSKWICNKWIRERRQVFRRPCLRE